MGAISDSPEQTLGKVTPKPPHAFGTLGAVAFSELVRDLESLGP